MSMKICEPKFPKHVMEMKPMDASKDANGLDPREYGSAPGALAEEQLTLHTDKFRIEKRDASKQRIELGKDAAFGGFVGGFFGGAASGFGSCIGSCVCASSVPFPVVIPAATAGAALLGGAALAWAGMKKRASDGPSPASQRNKAAEVVNRSSREAMGRGAFHGVAGAQAIAEAQQRVGFGDFVAFGHVVMHEHVARELGIEGEPLVAAVRLSDEGSGLFECSILTDGTEHPVLAKDGCIYDADSYAAYERANENRVLFRSPNLGVDVRHGAVPVKHVTSAAQIDDDPELAALVANCHRVSKLAAQVKAQPEIFRALSAEDRDDPSIARAALNGAGYNFFHAGPTVKASVEHLCLALPSFPDAIRSANPRLFSDAKAMLPAIAASESAMLFVDGTLWYNSEFLADLDDLKPDFTKLPPGDAAWIQGRVERVRPRAEAQAAAPIAVPEPAVVAPERDATPASA
jgi:hypothetical protein